jgi:hypothetical protein
MSTLRTDSYVKNPEPGLETRGVPHPPPLVKPTRPVPWPPLGGSEGAQPPGGFAPPDRRRPFPPGPPAPVAVARCPPPAGGLRVRCHPYRGNCS